MKDYKIVILGDGGVGKSNIIIKFLNNRFISYYDMTIEDRYKKILMLDDEIYNLDIIDTAGQEEYTSMRYQYITYGNYFVLVYSVDSNRTFENIDTYIQQILEVKDGKKDTSIILVGNKIDLNERREVSTEDGQLKAEKYNIPFIESSAKTGENIDNIFIKLLKSKNNDDLNNQNKNKKKHKQKCIIT